MTVTKVDKDTEKLRMTIVSEFDAPLARVWQMWANPRLLERWWGPPTYPATVVEHDLVPGGTVTYFMTGPTGDQPKGWWRVQAVEVPRLLAFVDGFADDAGTPNPDMPITTIEARLEQLPGGGTRMSIATTFASLDNMEQLIAMGMEEGMSLALGQIDALLAA